MKKPAPLHKSGPLWRVALDERGKVVVRDDAGVLHRLPTRHFVRQAILLLGPSDTDEAKRAQACAFGGKEGPLWLAKLNLGLGMVIVVGLVAMAFVLPLTIGLAGVVPLLFGTLVVGALWHLQHQDGQARRRADIFVMVATRLCDNACGICDHTLVTEAEPGALTQCAECSAAWDVQGWQASFIFPAPQNASTSKLASLRAITLRRSARGRPAKDEEVKRGISELNKQARNHLPREIISHIRHLGFGEFCCLLGSIAMFFACRFITAQNAWPPQSNPLPAMVIITAAPLAFAAVLVYASASERARAAVQKERRSINICEWCERPLTMHQCVADRTVVCQHCGARRSEDIELVASV